MSLLVFFDSDDAIEKLGEAQNAGRHQAGVSGLHHFAEFVSKTTKPLVPLDTGLLEGSIYEVQQGPPNGRGFGLQELYGLGPGLFAVDVWYSAEDFDGYDYAEYQHEMDLHHPKKGTMLYLALGLAYSVPFMADIIAARLRVVY